MLGFGSKTMSKQPRILQTFYLSQDLEAVPKFGMDPKLKVPGQIPVYSQPIAATTMILLLSLTKKTVREQQVSFGIIVMWLMVLDIQVPMYGQ